MNMGQYKKYIENIRVLFIDTYESAGGQGFRFFHSVNVANISAFIAEKHGAKEEDKRVAVIAAIFHDVAKYTRKQDGGFLDASHNYEKENNLESHEQQSARMVKDFLIGDISEAEILSIQNTISNHGNPKTLPEKILYDSDELSEMGSMNIWKMYTYSANKKRNVSATLQYWFETDKDRHMEKAKSLFLIESREEAKIRIEEVDSEMKKLKEQLIGS